jgi:hypothetical protein
MRTLCLSLLLFVSFPVMVHGQETSLGEIARRARAEKNKPAQPNVRTTAPNSEQAAKATTRAGQPAGQPPETEQQAMVRHIEDSKSNAAEHNLHQVDDYQESIRTLFNIENFEKIDELADQARSTKARMTGGFWQIHLLETALTKPAHGIDESTESEWQLHMDRLQRWVKQRPQSITARVALAGAYLDYGWKARGGGYADQVTEEGWQLFAERSETAGKILAEAFNLPTKDPEWYVMMQDVMRAQQVSKEMKHAMFEKAVAFEPDYYYYYRMEAENLLPKWDGEEGEVALFAAQAADRLGGKRGDMIYYEIAAYVNCSCDARNQPNGMSWPRIKRGYAAVEEQYGASLANMNQMAKFAAAAGDLDFTHELMTRIGENWDPATWKTRERFETVRSWAGFSDIQKTFDEGKKAAEANLLTPAGRQYDGELSKSFQAGYGEILGACVKLSGENPVNPFDLFMQIGKTGMVENIYFSAITRVSVCLASKVSSGRFPPPPEPAYWVKVGVSFQP